MCEEVIMFRRITAEENRYLRMGLYGKAGSGKTRTATEVAIGLALEGEHKAIAFVDTEGNGVDYMQPFCDAAGVGLFGIKTRNFKEVVDSFAEVPGLADVLIIDSVSHVWREIMDRWKADTGKDYIDFQDWGTIKQKWGQLTTAYLQAQFHTIVCGRAGFVYEQQLNDRGKKEIVAVGTKMKAEGEFEHEPSLLVEMHLVQNPGHRPINRAVVLKDRSDQINGMEIDFPTFASFEPIIRALSPAGKHVALDASSEAGVLFGSRDFSRIRDKRRRKELIDRVGNAFKLVGLGKTKDDEKRKVELYLRHYGLTSFKEAINKLPLEDFENGTRALESELGIVQEREALPDNPEVEVGDADADDIPF